MDSNHLLPINRVDANPMVIRQILCVATHTEVQSEIKQLLTKIDSDLQCHGVESVARVNAFLRGNTKIDCILIEADLVRDFLSYCQQYDWHLPIIALVEDEESATIDALFDLGIVDYLEQSQLSPAKLRRSFHQAIRLQRAQWQNRELGEKLDQVSEQYRFTLDDSKDGMWTWLISQTEIQGDHQLRQLLGLKPDQLPISINQLKDRIHPHDYPTLKTSLERHLCEQEVFSVETRVRHESGQFRDFWVRGQVQKSASQESPCMVGLITDITERKRTERRNRFLSQASSLLNASLDSKTTLENLAWLAVPRIADWCVLELNVKQNGRPVIVTNHMDRTKESLVEEFGQLIAMDSTPKILQFAHRLSAEELKATIKQYDWSPSLVERLQLQSYVWIPLRVGSRSMGSIFFAWGESGRHCDPADLSLIQELAYRATWSIENERLYNEGQAAYSDLQGAIASLTEQRQRLETLQHLNALINRRLTNIPELLECLVRQICETVPSAQVCAIALFDPKQEHDFLVAVDGVNKEAIALERLLCEEKSWLRQVYEEGTPRLRNFAPNTLMPCSMAAVAIESVASGRLGVLVIGNWETSHLFSLEDCEFLTAVGEEAAIAIDNARLIKTLEQQNQELIEASRVKDLFLATISHELRTPMNAILGFSQVLLHQRQSNLGEREQQILKRILNNGRSLMALINDILDFSQMKLTELQLMPSTFNIQELLVSIVDELQSLADEKQLELHLFINLEDKQITHDQKRLRQVLVNLVANALAFTQQGAVEIQLDGQGNHINIEVKDTGIGIAPEHLKHIFSEFWQVQQDIHLTTSGTGLGLAIAQALVHRMQGTISVESQPDEGSNFMLQLPRTLKI
ncbi:MAG: ATP-binding protein [Limnothrix sp.]